MDNPTLHLLCGKIASGKSTLAATLGAQNGCVRMSEDTLLATLFADQLATPRDYLRCSGKLQSAIGPLVVDVLNAGTSVVLDFAANTIAQRAWMRGIIDQTHAQHVLHVFMTPDDVCLERLRQRNAAGTHPFAVTEEQFHIVTQHFVAPTADEGFNIVTHDG